MTRYKVRTGTDSLTQSWHSDLTPTGRRSLGGSQLMPGIHVGVRAAYAAYSPANMPRSSSSSN